MSKDTTRSSNDNDDEPPQPAGATESSDVASPAGSTADADDGGDDEHSSFLRLLAVDANPDSKNEEQSPPDDNEKGVIDDQDKHKLQLGSGDQLLKSPPQSLDAVASTSSSNTPNVAPDPFYDVAATSPRPTLVVPPQQTAARHARMEEGASDGKNEEKAEEVGDGGRAPVPPAKVAANAKGNDDPPPRCGERERGGNNSPSNVVGSVSMNELIPPIPFNPAGVEDDEKTATAALPTTTQAEPTTRDLDVDTAMSMPRGNLRSTLNRNPPNTVQPQQSATVIRSPPRTNPNNDDDEAMSSALTLSQFHEVVAVPVDNEIYNAVRVGIDSVEDAECDLVEDDESSDDSVPPLSWWKKHQRHTLGLVGLLITGLAIAAVAMSLRPNGTAASSITSTSPTFSPFENPLSPINPANESSSIINSSPSSLFGLGCPGSSTNRLIPTAASLQEDGWQLIAWAKGVGGMFNGNTNLDPASSYGNSPVDLINVSPTQDDFQISYADLLSPSGNDILFITGDHSVWGVTQFEGAFPLNAVYPFNVQSSPEICCSGGNTEWFVCQGDDKGVQKNCGHILFRGVTVEYLAAEDPWISIAHGDHMEGYNQDLMVWGENNFRNHDNLKNARGGMKVYIRPRQAVSTIDQDNIRACQAQSASPFSQASFTEDFSGGNLPTRFERSGDGVGAFCCEGTKGGSVFENGVVRFTGEDTRGDASGGLRSFLRTRESDYSANDFVAEVTVKIVPNQGSPNVGRNIAFFGLGPAETGLFGQPEEGIYLGVTPSNFDFGFVAALDDGTQTRVPGCSGDGTYRLRMEWDSPSQTLNFLVDENYVGGPFVADCALPPLYGGDNGFDATNARLFIGGDWNTEFDDFVVTLASDSTASTQKPTLTSPAATPSNVPAKLEAQVEPMSGLVKGYGYVGLGGCMDASGEAYPHVSQIYTFSAESCGDFCNKFQASLIDESVGKLRGFHWSDGGDIEKHCYCVFDTGSDVESIAAEFGGGQEHWGHWVPAGSSSEGAGIGPVTLVREADHDAFCYKLVDTNGDASSISTTIPSAI